MHGPRETQHWQEKMTLIKSIMLAKFTHLFLALLNPPEELILDKKIQIS